MKRMKTMIILALTAVMVLGAALSVSAESSEVNGYCYFNGKKIVSDFDTNVIADTISGLEPGDDVTFTVKFENKYGEDTHWYMRNEALKTLEQSYDRTQNGGYTYKLTHVAPDGAETVLFDNSSVGGEYKMPVDGSKTSHGGANTGEGLHQATNAADEWFFIQTLAKNQSGYSKLYVKFDGDSEVNDYMDTAGELLLAYAVELDSPTGTHKKVKTGDDLDLLNYLAVMLGALLLLILTIMSYRRDRREARAEAAGASSDASMTGTAAKGRRRSIFRKERE